MKIIIKTKIIQLKIKKVCGVKGEKKCVLVPSLNSLVTKGTPQNKPRGLKGFLLTLVFLQIKVFHLKSDPARQLDCFQVWNMTCDDLANQLPLRGTSWGLKVEFKNPGHKTTFSSVSTGQHFHFKRHEKVDFFFLASLASSPDCVDLPARFWEQNNRTWQGET